MFLYLIDLIAIQLVIGCNVTEDIIDSVGTIILVTTGSERFDFSCAFGS
jgi:hypothetical protein